MHKFEITSALFGNFCTRILKNYCHICWSQPLWISVVARFCEETKMAKFRTINANFWYFLTRISKKLLRFEISTFKLAYLQNFTKKKNKNGWIWDKKCLIYVFFGWNLKTILSYLKSAPLNSSSCKILRKNKMPKFETKNGFFSFWL